MKISDWVGFIGVTILLVAFLLNSLKKMPSDSFWYILLNLLGAGLACLASVLIDYIPFVILEGAWMLVSLISFVRFFIEKKSV
jgi:hypothetical protein